MNNIETGNSNMETKTIHSQACKLRVIAQASLPRFSYAVIPKNNNNKSGYNVKNYCARRYVKW